jgi:Domain of unknown function (DUF4382)
MTVRMTRRWIVIATLVVATGAMACGGSDSPAGPTQTASPNDSGGSGGSGGDGPGATPAGSGRLTVKMKDTPFSDAQAVLVTFKEVSVHRSESGWESIDFAGGATMRTCDLKQLQNATDVLGVATLPAGHYTQIRLTVESAALYFDNPATAGPCGDAATFPIPAGTPFALKIPSGTVKLNREFTVPDGGATTMLLDFDGDKSIKQTGGSNGNGNGAAKGGYTMTPVIHVVEVQ